MRWKFYALLMLAAVTVTACAHPLERAASSRVAYRQELAEKHATISGGACDDIGQFIVKRDGPPGATWEASAAPHRRR